MNRIDDIDQSGLVRVRYVMQYLNYSFEFQSTKMGVVITGTTPPLNDMVSLNSYFWFAERQYQALRETGNAIDQQYLERGATTGYPLVY